MKKRMMSILLSAIMAASCCVPAFARESKTLRFNADGKFTILHLTDFHVTYPMNETIAEYIAEMLETVKPDLAIMGGDMTENSDENKEKCIEQICNIFASHQTYFTFALGNHDAGEVNFNAYLNYGGPYCLAYDADPALSNIGTHDLPVYSSDGSRVAYNLYMFDSGNRAHDENGRDVGYDSVHKDQIEWFEARAEALKAANGGEPVPSMFFQHIIVQEIDDKVFFRSEKSAGAFGEDFDNGVHYTFLPIPRLYNFKEGYAMEKPCPGYYNYGQLDAAVKEGGVNAIVCGHDHFNNFIVDIDGVDIIATGSIKKHVPSRAQIRGSRVIVLDENSPSAYETEFVSYFDMAKAEGSSLYDLGEMNPVQTFFADLWKLFVDSSLKVWTVISGILY